MEVLKDQRDMFGVDFDKNKEALNKISVIRSKMLKNELAGYITKFIKNELRNEEAKTVQSKEEIPEEVAHTGNKSKDEPMIEEAPVEEAPVEEAPVEEVQD